MSLSAVFSLQIVIETIIIYAKKGTEEESAKGIGYHAQDISARDRYRNKLL